MSAERGASDKDSWRGRRGRKDQDPEGRGTGRSHSDLGGGAGSCATEIGCGLRVGSNREETIAVHSAGGLSQQVVAEVQLH